MTIVLIKIKTNSPSFNIKCYVLHTCFIRLFDIKFNINVMPCILFFINVLWYIKTNSSLGIRILTEVYVPKLLLFVTGGEAK